MRAKLTRDFLIATALAVPLCFASAFVRATVPVEAAAAPRLVSASSGSTKTPCFFRRDWHGGWKTAPDAWTIYIRVSGSVYRLDLESSYPLLKDPFAVLTNRDSADTICTPLDFRLTVSNQAGVVQWPIVKRMTRLTPAQVQALPKRLRP